MGGKKLKRGSNERNKKDIRKLDKCLFFDASSCDEKKANCQDSFSTNKCQNKSSRSLSQEACSERAAHSSEKCLARNRADQESCSEKKVKKNRSCSQDDFSRRERHCRVSKHSICISRHKKHMSESQMCEEKSNEHKACHEDKERSNKKKRDAKNKKSCRNNKKNEKDSCRNNGRKANCSSKKNRKACNKKQKKEECSQSQSSESCSFEKKCKDYKARHQRGRGKCHSGGRKHHNKC